MRRKDREVTDPVKIEEVLKRCACCRLGFNDNGEVYIVPLSFGYEKTEESFTLYFHGAKQGRKIDLIQKNPKVGFEMDTGYDLIDSDLACSYSARYQSIIGSGSVSIINDVNEKAYALSLIMERTTGKKDWSFSEERLNGVAVFKLEVAQLSCKERS